ncbi:hypothetical protein [Cupriavidus sp. DF5525]|uniref:hypothetical protein n=1 Tax=Cupriavidus sp. DF5525 TaxID=3160989 RepID=UPI0032E03010
MRELGSVTRHCLSNASITTRDPSPGCADSANSMTNWSLSPAGKEMSEHPMC